MKLSRALVVAFAACAAVTTASADSHKKPTKPAKPEDPAEVAYQEGRRHYDLREWDEAIASFKESYRMRTDERSLFNIAQSYRLKGDCVEALGFYQTYKRNFPDAEGVPAVDKLMPDIEKCAHDKAAADAKLPPTKPLPAQQEPAQPPAGESDAVDDAHPGRTKRIAGIVVGGVGIAAIATGVVFGLHAQSLASDVGTGMGTFDPQLQADGQDADRNAKILFAAGGALVVTGVVLYLVGRPGSEAAHVAIVPSPTGGSLSWRASF